MLSNVWLICWCGFGLNWTQLRVYRTRTPESRSLQHRFQKPETRDLSSTIEIPNQISSFCAPCCAESADTKSVRFGRRFSLALTVDLLNGLGASPASSLDKLICSIYCDLWRNDSDRVTCCVIRNERSTSLAQELSKQ